jgi:hypothetical protein
MSEMKYSDEILERMRKQGRGLTASERHELREAYLHEQQTDERHRDNLRRSVKDFKDQSDPLNMPRHQVNCPDFVECQFDFKCRNYSSTYVKCQNCILHETDGICFKDRIHTEKAFNMMITRGRIDLDDNRK